MGPGVRAMMIDDIPFVEIPFRSLLIHMRWLRRHTQMP
jgi:hypothetical protein